MLIFNFILKTKTLKQEVLQDKHLITILELCLLVINVKLETFEVK